MAAPSSNTFRIERRAHIAAAPQAIFPFIDDFHHWALWSPYEGLDPKMKRTYTGAPSGVGAVYHWESAGKAGVGSMQITHSAPSSQLMIKLDFTKPFSAHNTAEFVLTPDGTGTSVLWAMTGPKSFMSRVMGLFINIDKMVGKDFEVGLANLKRLAEQQDNSGHSS